MIWSRCGGQVDGQVGDDARRGAGQHEHPVAEVDALVDVVGDQQHRAAVLAAHPQQQVLELGPGLRVDRRERLVHQQQRRPGGQRPGDRHPLLHAAGELPRVLGRRRPRDRPTPAPRAPAPAARRARTPATAAGTRRCRARTATGTASGCSPGTRPRGRPGTPCDRVAVQRDRAGGRLDQPGDAAQQGRLAAAGRADDAGELVLRRP